MKHPRTITRVAASAAAALAMGVTGTIAGTGVAAAAPPPGLQTTFSSQILTIPLFGCFGNIFVGIDQPADRRDRVDITLIPQGTYGTAACPLDLMVGAFGSLGENSHLVHLNDGPVTIPVTPGLGLANITARTIFPDLAWPVNYLVWLRA